KVFIYTAKGFGEHSLVVRSAALTFYTLMSIVPIAALVFGIAKGFGLETRFNEYLYTTFPQYDQLITQIIGFANNMLMRTKGGLIASIGFVVLFWAVMKVFSNIENAFNNIWEVRKARSLPRKFSDYMSVVFVAPILWILSNGIALHLRNTIQQYSQPWFVDLLYGLASIVTLWVLFAFIYRVMPNTKVKTRSAFMAGIIAGTIFQIFQVVYVYIQTQVSAYNAIYGSFAALPLFLIWVQTSWQILLLGAELSFAYQNITKYEQEKESHQMSYDLRRKVMIAVMYVIIRHFTQNQGPVPSEAAANELNLPVRTVRDVIFDLERAGLIASVRNEEDEKTNLYIPATDIYKLTLFDVIDRVETSGLSNLETVDSPELETVNAIVDHMKVRAYGSPDNVLLMDIAPLPAACTAEAEAQVQAEIAGAAAEAHAAGLAGTALEAAAATIDPNPHADIEVPSGKTPGSTHPSEQKSTPGTKKPQRGTGSKR
ncbi:MAG: YihY family inner membrane protein, partial [Rikenellaceae bacterium]|nr:YihY family inner membrane protein [Rikenellaceae bacterium]